LREFRRGLAWERHHERRSTLKKLLVLLALVGIVVAVGMKTGKIKTDH
jgi:hypothetical protein